MGRTEDDYTFLVDLVEPAEAPDLQALIDFRQQIRDLVGLHWDARDEQIIEAVRRLTRRS